MKITAVLLKLGQTRVRISPMSDLVFINPGIYLHSMATVFGKSAENQFPAYVTIVEHVTAFAGDI